MSALGAFFRGAAGPGMLALQVLAQGLGAGLVAVLAFRLL